jgi:hypothetical protein
VGEGRGRLLKAVRGAPLGRGVVVHDGT